MPVVTNYPEPRLDRGAPIPTSPTSAGLPIPQVTLWPFSTVVGAAQRNTLVSDRFVGPAIIDELYLWIPTWPAASIITGLAILVADENGGEGTNTGDTPPSGRTIFAPIDEQSAQNLLAGDVGGIPQHFGQTGVTQHRFKLGVPVEKDTFYLKVTLRNGSVATNVQLTGVLRVLGALTDEQLANFQ